MTLSEKTAQGMDKASVDSTVEKLSPQDDEDVVEQEIIKQEKREYKKRNHDTLDEGVVPTQEEVTYVKGQYFSIDVHQTRNTMFVTAEMPGMKAGSLELRMYSDHMLTIYAAKDTSTKRKKLGTLQLAEINHASYERTIAIPDDVDENSIVSTYNEGFLTLEFKRKSKNINRPKAIVPKRRSCIIL